jgi:CHAT domain-containing protein/Flp pilus assembly protein TadD
MTHFLRSLTPSILSLSLACLLVPCLETRGYAQISPERSSACQGPIVESEREQCWSEMRALVRAGLADGEVLQAVGSGVPGLGVLQQALALAEQLEDTEAVIQVTNYLGEAHHRVGQYPQAIALHERALALAESSRNAALIGASANALGRVYTSFGKLDQAMTQHQRALEIFQQLGDGVGEATTQRDLAAAYEENDQPDQALSTYQSALVISQRVNDLEGQAAALHGLGDIYLDQDRLGDAVSSYQQAVSIRRDLNDQAGLQATLTRLGGAYHLQRQYDQAFAVYEEARDLALASNDIASEATLLQNLGISYARRGNNTAALDTLQEAAVLFDELGYRGLQGETLSMMGTILKVEGQTELAIALYKQAIAVLEAVRQDLRVLPLELRSTFPQTFADTYRTLADLLLQQDRVAEAHQILDLLKVQEVDDYLDDLPPEAAAPLGEAPLQPAETQLLELYDQTVAEGRELAQLRRIPRSQRTDAQQARINALVTSQQAKTANFNDFIDSPAVKNLVAQLSETSRQQNLNLLHLNSLQDNLQTLDQAVLIYPLLLEDRLELVLVTPYAPPIHRTVAVSRAELETTLNDVRQALINKNRDARAATQRLYEYLIRPLEADLAQAEAKTLVYSPDSLLRYVPLGALYDGNQWLIERFQITNITAASLTDFDAPPSNNNPSILAAAFSEGSYRVSVGTRQVTLAGLPFAKVEIETVADRFPDHTQLLNAAFSRSATVPQMEDYSIVHLATHAEFVSGQPEDSFILFGDGDRVTLREVSSWSLRNVDLVVLSACQTGLGGELGTGEEVLGFGYQIQRAGAKSAIASLWSVDDGGTQALMTAFYTYLGQGHSKAEALRQAQIDLISDNREVLEATSRGFASEFGAAPQQLPSSYSHPYYWSPFILIGNGL